MPDRVYSSPLVRAVQTAKLVTGKDPTEKCDFLSERHFGKWSGAHWDQIYKRLDSRGTTWGEISPKISPKSASI